MNWRFILAEPQSGARQMALDETILTRFSMEDSPPTIRLYQHESPWISIGAFQPAKDELNLSRIRHENLLLVRRPAGGGAVFHGADLSYSIVARKSDVSRDGGVLAIYRAISSVIIIALDLLGIRATMADSHHTNQPSPGWGACFATVAPFELLAEGRKLTGHAQRQRGDVFLQQGTILMNEGQESLAPLLKLPTSSTHKIASTLRKRAICWQELAERLPSIQEISQAFEGAFQKALEAELRTDRIQPDEERQANRLTKEKYEAADWNLRL